MMMQLTFGSLDCSTATLTCLETANQARPRIRDATCIEAKGSMIWPTKRQNCGLGILLLVAELAVKIGLSNSVVSTPYHFGPVEWFANRHQQSNLGGSRVNLWHQTQQWVLYPTLQSMLL